MNNNIDKKLVFRSLLEEVMQQEKLLDSDFEEIDPNLYYSRGIRVLCVLDPRFEEQIDMLTNSFKDDREKDHTVLSQTYETLYGNVTVSFTAGKEIVISLSDTDEERR